MRPARIDRKKGSERESDFHSKTEILSLLKQATLSDLTRSGNLASPFTHHIGSRIPMRKSLSSSIASLAQSQVAFQNHMSADLFVYRTLFFNVLCNALPISNPVLTVS